MLAQSYQEEFEYILKQFTPRKENLLKCLHELQDNHPQNYLTPEVLDAVSGYFNLSKGQLFGIVSYYTMFSLEPRGKNVIRFCKSPVCQMLGSTNLLAYLEKEFGLKPGQTSTDGVFTLELSECLGACDRGPAMMVNRELVRGLSTRKIDRVLNDIKKKQLK